MYRNGIRIDVIPQRVIIGNNYDELFKQCLNEEVHTLAAEFVKTYNDVVCQAIGLNCTISLQHNNPLRWMTRKFLKVKTPPKNVSMIPQFVIKTDDAKLTLAFSSVKATDLGRQKRFIAVDCNHHHGGPFKADGDISRIVMGWRNTQDTILLELGAVLELK